MAANQNPIVFLDVSINGAEPRRLVFELFGGSVLKVAENFKALCTGETQIRNEDGKLLHYKGTILHRVIKGLWAQGGCFSDSDDSELSRAHGENHHGHHIMLEDNNSFPDGPGALLVPNLAFGKKESEFCVTFNAAPHLDGKYVVFGKLVQGFETLEEIEKVDTDDGRPIVPVKITNSGELYGCRNDASFPEENAYHRQTQLFKTPGREEGLSTHISKIYGPAKRRRVSAIRDFPLGCGPGVSKEAPIEAVAPSLAKVYSIERKENYESPVADTIPKDFELVSAIRDFPSECEPGVRLVSKEAPIEAVAPSLAKVYSIERKENYESPVEDTIPKDFELVSAIREFPSDCGPSVSKEPIEAVTPSMAKFYSIDRKENYESPVEDTKPKGPVKMDVSGCFQDRDSSEIKVLATGFKQAGNADTLPEDSDQIDVASAYSSKSSTPFMTKNDGRMSSIQYCPTGFATVSHEKKLDEITDAISGSADEMPANDINPNKEINPPDENKDVMETVVVREKTEALGSLTRHAKPKKDVLECVKEVKTRASILYGPPKRRSISAIRDFPVGCYPSSAKISGEQGTRDEVPEANNFVSHTKFATENIKWMEKKVNDVNEEGKNDFVLRKAKGETNEPQDANKRIKEVTFRQRTDSFGDCISKQGMAESSVMKDLARETCENIPHVAQETCMADMDNSFLKVIVDGTIDEESNDTLSPDNVESWGGYNQVQVVQSKELDKPVLKRSLREETAEEQNDNVLTNVAGRSKLASTGIKKLNKVLHAVKHHGNKPFRVVAKSQLNASAVDNEIKNPNRKSIVIKSEKKISSCKRRYSNEEEGTSTILSQQMRQGMDIEFSGDRLIVQALMAAPNCPWRSGKTTKATRNPPFSAVKMKKDRNERKLSNKRTSPLRLSDSREIFLLGDQNENLNLDEENRLSPTPVRRELSVIVTPLGPPRVNPTSGCSSSNIKDSPPRNRVRRTLRLFQVICRKLLQEEETRTREPGRAHRVDLRAANILKEKNEWVNTGKPILGIVPGVEIGDEFHYRTELSVVGLHRPFQGGIDSTKKENVLLATSIVAGGNADELENSDVLIYSGSGGVPANGDNPPEDQKLERGNLALKNSIDAKEPVRVIRGSKEIKSDARDGKPKFFSTFTYDGLYMVEKYWKEKVPQGFLAFKFQLRRIPGQPELATKEVKKSKKLSARPGQCVKDISDGKEKIPICAVNTIDDGRPPPFKYITKIMYPTYCLLTPSRGCDCKNGCSDSEKCACAVKNGGEIPYNYNGAIVQAKPLVYECGPSCKCPPNCHNRVSQHGIKIQLEVFKTESCGWGVRSLNSIPSGSFICEYIGELLPDNVAEQLNNDEYLFGIGHNYDDSSLWEGLPAIIPEEPSNALAEVVDNNGFTIDASQNANVGRFLNHSCSPNLYAQNVLYDHDDRKMPHIMFFAAENIPPLQELTYHYNYQIDQVYDNHGNLKRKDCHCGSHECSGRLY